MVSQMKVNLLLLRCVSFSNVIFGQGLLREASSVRAGQKLGEGVFALGVQHKKLECFE